MQLIGRVRGVTAEEAVAGARLAGSALALTSLLVLFASAAFFALLLPLAVLATLNPTLTFGGVPPTAYPTSYLGAQLAWTVLLAAGVAVAARRVSLPPLTAYDTELPADYPPTRANERLAGLVEAVETDD